MRVIEMTGIGGPDVLRLAERADPHPGPNEVLVEIAAAGVNFMDVGVRRGIAWTEQPNPKPLGVEGAGKVISVGQQVRNVKAGDRVLFSKWAGTEVTIDGKEYMVMKESDIVGIVQAA